MTANLILDIYISNNGQLTGAKMPKRNPIRAEGKMIHVRLSEATHKKLRMQVAKEDTTMQDWLARLIEDELEQKNDKQSTM